jgi:uncharacterized membrane protein
MMFLACRIVLIVGVVIMVLYLAITEHSIRKATARTRAEEILQNLRRGTITRENRQTAIMWLFEACDAAHISLKDLGTNENEIWSLE